MNNSESGRKINQAVNTTSRAVGGALTQVTNTEKIILIISTDIVQFRHRRKVQSQAGGRLLQLNQHCITTMIVWINEPSMIITRTLTTQMRIRLTVMC